MREIIAIENDKIIVKVLTLGAILNSFYVKSLDVDIVLGFDNYMQYIEAGNASIGKSIGRCANRIGNAKFVLNGISYKLLANNEPNTLHGGQVQFGNEEWKVVDKSFDKVMLEYDSPDMESGFPGNLKVTATYELFDDELKITYTGLSDKDTIFNMTNHSYFNLDRNKSDILSHELMITANKVNLNDENGMALEESIMVEGTSFDFKEFREISDHISANGMKLNEYCKEILNGNLKTNKVLIDNLDTNYIYENFDEKILCILRNSKLNLEILSDLPDVQIYTGKSLNVAGRDGHYGSYAGIAVEPQYCPNAINYNSFIKPILEKNKKISHFIKYKVCER